MKDFYNILGTDVNSSQDEIRMAYKRLSLKLHPKLYQSDGYHQTRLGDVREAFETLNDPARRVAYDNEFKKYNSYNPRALSQKPGYTRVTRNIDVAFSITLIALTLVFGDYVYNSLYSTKKPDIVNHPAVAPVLPVATAVVKRYKKKHGAKITDSRVLYVQNTALSKPVAVADTGLSSQGSVSVSVEKSDNLYERPDNNPSASLVNTYVSTITPNVTGLVYMHQQDSYSSAIINKIPANASVTVLKKGDTFYKVRYGNVTGYVPRWTVQLK